MNKNIANYVEGADLNSILSNKGALILHLDPKKNNDDDDDDDYFDDDDDNNNNNDDDSLSLDCMYFQGLPTN